MEVRWKLSSPRRKSQTLTANRREGDNSRSKDRLDYWINIAKLADEGKISCIFFADSYAGKDVLGDEMKSIFAFVYPAASGLQLSSNYVTI
jgi:alkanesulfonate monooxygenase SsuD/methylene tetrahydromethanopterin reductase-like flavin-dependent oxidoreductase (luciferase family)